MTRPTVCTTLVVVLLLVGTGVAVLAETLTITLPRAQVRAGPDPKQAVIIQVEHGTLVERLETRKGWYKVRLANQDEGWLIRTAAQAMAPAPAASESEPQDGLDPSRGAPDAGNASAEAAVRLQGRAASAGGTAGGGAAQSATPERSGTGAVRAGAPDAQRDEGTKGAHVSRLAFDLWSGVVVLQVLIVLLLLDLTLTDPASPTLLARCVRRRHRRGPQPAAPHPRDASPPPGAAPPEVTRQKPNVDCGPLQPGDPRSNAGLARAQGRERTERAGPRQGRAPGARADHDRRSDAGEPRSMQEPPHYPIELDLSQAHVICPEPFRYADPDKGDDRICCTAIAGQWPVLIVADGAGARRDPSRGAVVAGDGWQAAEVVVEVTQRSLTRALTRPEPTVQTILDDLRGVYTECVTELRQHQIAAVTTLLIALLYETRLPAGPRAWWCYAFEGDGSIVVMNPRRQLAGKQLRTELLVPGQKIEETAMVSRQGCSVPPVVGCLVYEPGDLLYVASDGMDAAGKTLYQTRSTFLANYLYTHLHDNLEAGSLQDTLSHFQFNDDAVLGLIWTRE